MKVLQAPNTDWSKKVKCGYCTADLEVEFNDLTYIATGGENVRDYDPGYYRFTCAVCKSSCSLTESSVPSYLKHVRKQ